MTRYFTQSGASDVKYQREADLTGRRFNVVFRDKSGNLIIGILLH
jgi:hypothetical protein